MTVLVIDVGGTNVKVSATGRKDTIKIPSGPSMTARQMVNAVLKTVKDWKYDVVSIGFPGPVIHGKPLAEPRNLGGGWVGFNFTAAFKHPVKMVNDAAMQALGSYVGGGRMLFLGLGTGLGSALVWDRNLMSLELGDLPYPKGKIIENNLGVPGLEKLGARKWKQEVLYAVSQLRRALIADYVVRGGGLVHRFDRLPDRIVRGHNENAFLGGRRLWETKRNSPELNWRLV